MQWFPELEELAKGSSKLFVGNKIDLRNEHDDPKTFIRKEVARKIIEEELHSKYLECSALTQEGLKEVFDEAMRMALQMKQPKMKKKEKDSKCNLI